MQNYVVIVFNEDGDPPGVDNMNEEVLLERLNEGYYGKSPDFAVPGMDIDSGMFSGVLIIKGDICSPKPKEKVTEWKF